MNQSRPLRFAVLFTGITLLRLTLLDAAEPPQKVSFNRDILPILANNCFTCHGPDEPARKGELRLDTKDGALRTQEPVIQPGKSGESELLKRLLSTDPEQVMPPPKSLKKPTAEEIELIRRWIDDGAQWDKHWSYETPRRPAPPSVKNPGWIKNPIDAFVLAKLDQEGLQPAPEATKEQLLRRVTLDLTGLPPTPKEIDDFLKDTSPASYETAVDRLFRSPHYGERMVLPWLDAARYADSNGFQQDGDTYQYLWRDWVVRALNSNMPFDQFTIEQLAGDLLPNPTDDQKIATGFNRCHLLNGEGGAIAEEQRNVIVFDRVDVTATNWLGLTLACAQCHDHKYDPLTQRDYYQLFAFFNNVPESGTPPFGGQYRIADPFMFSASVEDQSQQQQIETRLAAAKAATEKAEAAPEVQAAQLAWEQGALKDAAPQVTLDVWSALGPFPAASFDAAYDTAFDPEKQVDLTKPALEGKLTWTKHPEWADGKVYELSESNSATYLVRSIKSEQAKGLTLSFGSDDAIKVWLNGKQVLANKALRAALPDQEKVKVELQPGENQLLVKIVNGGGIGGFYFKSLDLVLPDNILAILKTAPETRTADMAKQLREYFLANQTPTAVKQVRDQQLAVQKELDGFKSKLPRVMIMSDARPRKTHILDRGNYESPRAEVQAETPSALLPMAADLPKNRLGLARWLMSPEHPLTARVQVNRYWQTFFGKGLVKTTENLGTQCEPPTHPELLDWLAVEFRESGWNVKHIHRLIVTSATYRQSSHVSAFLRERDPENLLLARGARFRMPSLILRDIALASSGLLNTRVGGKPVYPYQPKDIWDGLAITKERDFTYPQSTGNDLFRRSLYTFWRRTVAPGNMFDASVRNTCKVRTSITCTPLHALTTLNDVTWVEAGRALAQRVIQETGTDPDARLSAAFLRVCGHLPAPEEIRILRRGLDRALASFKAKPELAQQYLSLGDSPRDAKIDMVEHAAYASVCLAIFNLDEALTKE
jgi:hypothetical protein